MVNERRQARRALSNRLGDLAERVREAHAAMSAAVQATAERALAAGWLLVEAKAECGHGDWLRFLARAGVAERQAQRLMQLARSGLKPDTVSDLGIKAALALAGLRQLPGRGDTLMVTAAPLGVNPLEVDAVTVLVFEAREAPGYYHVMSVAMRGAVATTTDRPIAAARADLIFGVVDELLGVDASNARYQSGPDIPAAA